MKSKILSKVIKYRLLPLCKRPRVVSRLRKKGILITFDDGPCERVTTDISAVLKEFGFRALFFHVGEQMARMPDLTRECLADGHEVAIHGYSHVDPLLYTRAEFVADYLRACDLLCELSQLSIPEIFYRPPWGRISVRLLYYYWCVDASVVLWSRQLDEFEPSATAETIARSFSRIPPRPGDILLLHESDKTARALPSLLGEIQTLGIEVLHPRKALARDPPRETGPSVG
jgi:peptidoglycan/xylan/chitin deacetylase (PgdA/CDA1 family)